MKIETVFFPNCNLTIDYMIGLNAQDNFNVIDLGNPNDLWFHVSDLPSCHIIACISKEEKLTKKELIKSHLLNSSLINVKQKELIDDGFVYKHNKKIKLTRLGFLLAKIFIFYRNMLNLNDATG